MESAIRDVALNIETVKNLLKANLDKYGNIDFVFLPELWTVGWDCPSFTASAEVLEESKAVKMLKEIAKEGYEYGKEDLIYKLFTLYEESIIDEEILRARIKLLNK